ncbi:MAG: OB-fold nucleic acid binding domain-containing protein, partial [Acidobacteriota bacterium]
IQDAQRHGVAVRAIDVNHSHWRCTWEDRPARGDRPAGAARIGLRFVHGVTADDAARIVAAREAGPLRGAEDLARRAALGPRVLRRLAETGALAGFGLDRREALWQVARVGRPAGPLFDDAPMDRAPAATPLAPMDAFAATMADLTTSGVTVGPHPMAHLRAALTARDCTPLGQLEQMRHGARVRIAGAVIVRQRPGSAKGVLFLTLEDETGMAQAIFPPDSDVLKQARNLGDCGALEIAGVLQRRDGVLAVQARAVEPLGGLPQAGRRGRVRVG